MPFYHLYAIVGYWLALLVSTATISLTQYPWLLWFKLLPRNFWFPCDLNLNFLCFLQQFVQARRDGGVEPGTNHSFGFEHLKELDKVGGFTSEGKKAKGTYKNNKQIWFAKKLPWKLCYLHGNHIKHILPIFKIYTKSRINLRLELFIFSDRYSRDFYKWRL